MADSAKNETALADWQVCGANGWGCPVLGHNLDFRPGGKEEIMSIRLPIRSACVSGLAGLAVLCSSVLADEPAGPRLAAAGGNAAETAATAKPDEPTGLADPGFSAKLGQPRPVRAIPRRLQPPSGVRLLPPEEILKNRSHDIILDANGAFTGRMYSITPEGLLPARSMNVRLLTDGGLAAETTTNETGLFSITGLPQQADVGGIFASGPAGIVVYGVRMLPASAEFPADREIDVESAVVQVVDSPLAQQLIRGGIGTRDLRFNGPLTALDEKFPYGEGPIATSIAHDSVQIAADGKVYGQVNLLDERTGRLREVLSMRVYFLRDGVEIGSSRVAPNGAFSVPGLQPGIHALVGVGRDGVFAIGVEVLPFKAAAMNGANGFVPVRLMLTTEIAVAPVGAANINAENFGEFFDPAIAALADPMAPAAAAAAAAPAAAPGVAGAGGAAGGGSGGGGGLLGPLLAGGAIGGIGGAIIAEGDPATPSK